MTCDIFLFRRRDFEFGQEWTEESRILSLVLVDSFSLCWCLSLDASIVVHIQHCFVRHNIIIIHQHETNSRLGPSYSYFNFSVVRYLLLLVQRQMLFWSAALKILLVLFGAKQWRVVCFCPIAYENMEPMFYCSSSFFRNNNSHLALKPAHQYEYGTLVKFRGVIYQKIII
jgi:hypothetical protein